MAAQESPPQEHNRAEHLKLVASLREFGIGGSDEPSGGRPRSMLSPPPWGFVIAAVVLLAGLLFLADVKLFERTALSGETALSQETALSERTALSEATPAPAASPSLATAGALEAIGYVLAERTATVSSHVVGRVAEVSVAVGDRVQAGQVLARMDERAARIELQRLRLGLEAERLNLNIKQADFALAERDLERALYLDAQRAANAVLIEERRNRVAVLGAEREAIALRVEMSEKHIDLQQQNLRDLIIVAPFDGIVTDVAANPGEIVSPASGGGTFTRTGICTIIDVQSIGVMLQINERFLPRVRLGDPVRMTLPALGDRRLSGTVARIAPVADRRTGTIDILLSPEPGARADLKPGLRVNALLGDD